MSILFPRRERRFVWVLPDEGKLKLEAPFLDYIREDLPEEYDPALEKITVYDLLTMQAGSPFAATMSGFQDLRKTGRPPG